MDGYSSTCPRHQSERCFMEWMELQELDLAELVQTSQRLRTSSSTTTRTTMDPTPAELAQKSIDHFQQYADKRAHLAENDIAASWFMSPTWNSQLENSLLWIAGCRPSMFIRMLYALCGSQFESDYVANDQGIITSAAAAAAAAAAAMLDSGTSTSLGELTWGQMNAINELHMKTVREEEKLTTKLASLQEDMADNPICRVVAAAVGRRPPPSEEMERTLEGHEKAMLRMLKEADKLRISTLKEVVRVLTPIQAVDYLATGKNLHLTLHEFGKHKDQAVDAHSGSSATTAGPS